MDGYFENNSNYDSAEDLYHHLLDKWKFCWIVDKAKVNGTEEFAKVMGCNMRTAQSRVRNALKIMRKEQENER